MKTPTHLCLGWLLARTAPDLPKPHRRIVLAGSVAPDLPLTLAYLSIVAVKGPTDIGASMDYLYFQNDIFISLHHILHSPLSLALIMFVSTQATIHGFRRAQSVTCFSLGALTHAIADALTHGRDGLLVFWPINSDYRFDAGINQWDDWRTALVILVAEFLIIAVAATLWLKGRVVHSP